jgi:hypothetical protein
VGWLGAGSGFERRDRSRKTLPSHIPPRPRAGQSSLVCP